LEFDEYIYDVKRKRPTADNPEQRKRRRSITDKKSDQIEIADQVNVGNITDGQSGSSKSATPKSSKKVSKDNGGNCEESAVLGGCVVVVNDNLPGDESDSRVSFLHIPSFAYIEIYETNSRLMINQRNSMVLRPYKEFRGRWVQLSTQRLLSITQM